MAAVRQVSAHPDTVIKTFIVDDDLYVRSSLPELLLRFGDLEIVGVFADGTEAVAAAALEPPDVILMDTHMPGLTGVEATRQILRQSPQVRVLALSSLPDQAMVTRMQAAGAVGCLSKDTPVPAIASAIEAVHLGLVVMSPTAVTCPDSEESAEFPDLTPMDAEILGLICRGFTNVQIAERVSRATSTIKHRVSALMDRLDVTNRTMLAITAHAYLDRKQ